MSADGQRTIWRRNIAENFIHLRRVHERYRQTDRQTTDGRTTTYTLKTVIARFIYLRAKASLYSTRALYAVTVVHLKIYIPDVALRYVILRTARECECVLLYRNSFRSGDRCD